MPKRKWGPKDGLFCRAFDKAAALEPGEPSTLTKEENAELLKRIARWSIKWEALKAARRRQQALMKARMLAAFARAQEGRLQK